MIRETFTTLEGETIELLTPETDEDVAELELDEELDDRLSMSDEVEPGRLGQPPQ